MEKTSWFEAWECWFEAWECWFEVWECWFKDSTIVEELLLQDNPDEDPQEVIKSSKMKYPNGRMIKYVGDVILEDMASPYPKEFGVFPYVHAPLIQPSDDSGYSRRCEDTLIHRPRKPDKAQWRPTDYDLAEFYLAGDPPFARPDSCRDL